MALDVPSSLAHSLFATQRAAALRSKPEEPKATPGQNSAAAAQAAPPAKFGRYVEDASKSGVGRADERAPAAPSRKQIPGQTAGSRDAIVTPAAAPAESAAMVAPGNAAPGATPDKGSAQAVQAMVGREALVPPADAAQLSDVAAQGAAAAAQEGAPLGTVVPRMVALEAAQAGQAETTAEASDDQAAEEEAKPITAAMPLTAELAPAVPSMVGAVPSAAAPDVVKAAPRDAISGEASPDAAAVAIGVALVEAPGGTNPDEVAERAAGSVIKAVPGAEAAKDAAKEAAAAPAEAAAAPDGEAQADVSQIVEARKAALAGNKAFKPGESGGVEVGKEPASSKASAEAMLEVPRGAHHDGLRFGGEVFSQVLDGFAGAHAANRGGGLLAQLDPTLAAQAQNARLADMPRPTPLQMLPVEIGMQAVRGAREFQIRLDPAELGRVDVKLHISDKGEVNATMIVERPETLQMLRRDATTLAQAFEQAGLKQGENALSFSLRGEGQGQSQHQQASGGRSGQTEDPALSAQITEIVSRRVLIPNASLDRVV